MTVLNTPVNGKIQGLFKIFECISSIFQGKFNFQGLFKTVLYIQVLFKPVRTLYGVCAMGKNSGNPNQVCMKFKGTTGISFYQSQIRLDGWLRMGLLPPPPREFCRHILSCRELKAKSFKTCLHSVLWGVSL